MSFKFVYFNGRGRGELVRLLFAAAGVKYEDKRIEFKDWPELKPTTPQGSLPILEVEGEVLCQSMAIARYVAKKFKLMGGNDIEEAKVNIVLETVTDLRIAAISAKFEKDEAKKETMLKKLKDETIPNTLKILEKMVKDNGCKEGFIVGKGLTAADLVLHEGLQMCLTMSGLKLDVLDAYKGVKAAREKVETSPKVASYLKTRPVTEF